MPISRHDIEPSCTILRRNPGVSASRTTLTPRAPPAIFFSNAGGPHPRRVLTLMPPLGFARPRLGMAAGAPYQPYLPYLPDLPRAGRQAIIVADVS